MVRTRHPSVVRLFAVRVSGLASGLALAVRPAGLADSGAQGWVPKIVSAKRFRNDLRVPLTLERPARTMRGREVLWQ
jgi:hypothetical protein